MGDELQKLTEEQVIDPVSGQSCAEYQATRRDPRENFSGGLGMPSSPRT
jgi:hypothetical protein